MTLYIFEKNLTLCQSKKYVKQSSLQVMISKWKQQFVIVISLSTNKIRMDKFSMWAPNMSQYCFIMLLGILQLFLNNKIEALRLFRNSYILYWATNDVAYIDPTKIIFKILPCYHIGFFRI